MLSAAAVVVSALSLLGRSGPAVPIKVVDHAPAGASVAVEGFLLHDPDAIYLVTSTPRFRDAQHGDFDALRHIASIIVHEQWHVGHGADERGAYLAQLTTLSALGASSTLIGTVRKSMVAVLAAQKRLRKPELTLAREIQ